MNINMVVEETTEVKTKTEVESEEDSLAFKLRTSAKNFGYSKDNLNTRQTFYVLKLYSLSGDRKEYRCELQSSPIDKNSNTAFTLTASDQGLPETGKKRVLTILHTEFGNFLNYSITQETKSGVSLSQPMPIEERDQFMKELLRAWVDAAATEKEFLAQRNDPKNKPPYTTEPIVFLPPASKN